MRVGDTVPVNIGHHVVCQATVRELGDGTATLVVPATLVVMGTRTELSDLPREEPGTEIIIDGVEQAPPAEENSMVQEPQENNEAVVEAAEVTEDNGETQ